MSNKTRQHQPQESGSGAPNADETGALSSQRAELDRLFAAAARAFDNVDMSDSQAFLDASRQTGGQ